MANKTIWKFELGLTDRQKIKMPVGAQIISCANHDDVICIWAVVDPDAPKHDCVFHIAGTGHPMPDAEVKHIGTVLAYPYVLARI